jgi:hypothetical protein
MDGVRGAVALLIVIADDNLPAAPSQDEGRAKPRGPTAHDQNINLHT